MKAYVYHAKPVSFRTLRERAQVSLLTLDADFDAVALIEVEDDHPSDDALEFAYRLTNHIDALWWENPGVKVLKESRSTSIGDVVVFEFNDGREEIWSVAGLGWTQLRF